MKEKNKDVLLAGTIADALGYLVEFKSLSEIKKEFGNNGVDIENFLEKKLIVSDDTQMTLFCYNALLDEIESQNIIEEKELVFLNDKIYKEYLNWFLTQGFNGIPNNTNNKLLKFSKLHYRRAPGMTCLSALSSKVIGTIDTPINNSKGCGTVMRTAPISFLNTSLENIFYLGARQGALTHGHKDGYLSSGFFSALLKEVMDRKDIPLSFKNSIAILKTYKESEYLVRYLEKIFNLYEKDVLYKGEGLTEFIGTGNTADEALAIGLYSALMAKSFKEVIDISVNHSGDSDSTAILAAQLFVAKNGFEDKYKSMIDNIDVKEVLNFLNIS